MKETTDTCRKHATRNLLLARDERKKDERMDG
jgi:hypothetical protein